MTSFGSCRAQVLRNEAAQLGVQRLREEDTSEEDNCLIGLLKRVSIIKDTGSESTSELMEKKSF